MKPYILIILFCAGCLAASAQQELTLYNMSSIGQSVRVNPSQFPTTKIYVGLPVISSTSLLLSNSFVFHDFYKKRTDDSVTIDIDNTVNQLSKNNLLTTSLNIDLLSAGFVFGSNYINFNVTEKVNVNFSYAKELLELLDKGNGPFIGQKLDFSKTGFDATHYREYGIGYSRLVSDRLTVGTRFKYLYGMENFSTATGDFGFYTAADDYRLQVPADIIINTSSQANAPGGFGSMSIGDYLFHKKNRGMALDFGGTFHVNNKLTVNASLIDLGYISWNSDVKNYRAAAGKYEFGGIDIKQFFADSSSGSQSSLDSLSNSFKTVTTENSYKTMLPVHAYMGLNYMLAQKLFVGTLVHAEFIQKTIQPTATLSLNKQFGRHLALSVDYSYINHRLNNFGTGLSVNAGPIQLYAISDNVLGILHPLDYNTAHLHFGINLIFGRKFTVKKGDLNFSRSHAERSKEPDKSKKKSNIQDRDGDGVPDAIDFCPDMPGLAKFDGCPDTDGDGIQDMFDNCPTEAGSVLTNGCPPAKKQEQPH